MSLQADIHWVQNEIGKITDPELLKKVKKILTDNEAIGYTSKGEKLTPSTYTLHIDKCIEQADHGKVTSQYDMEKEL